MSIEVTLPDGIPYYCEGPCKGTERVTGRAVYRISIDNVWHYRCAACLTTNLRGGVNAENSCYNCGDTPSDPEQMVCSDCGGHDDCISSDDGHYYEDCDSGSCSNCGDTPYYCSASCAISEGSEVWCEGCGEQVHHTTMCNDCKADGDCDECKTSAGSPALVGAASTITNPEHVDDDGNVVIDGLEIRF